MKIRNQKCVNKAISLVCLLSVLSLVSCRKENWYDIKSDKKLTVPTTLKDMQALMDNPLVFSIAAPAMGEAASDGHYLNDARALALTGYNFNAYTWSHEQPNIAVIDWIQAPSNGSYERVYYANLVLEGLMKIIPKNTEEQTLLKNVKGQALFHRANAFFELAQIFTPPYNIETAISKLGLALRLESDVNIPSTRSTLKQTYDQIINDLTLAKDLLPVTPLAKTRPCKPAVYALLARIYLSMEDYELAGINANLCLELYNTLINYSALNSTTTANPFSSYNPEVIFHNTRIAIPAVTFTNLLIEDSWYKAYSDNDLRKKIFFNRNATTGLITYKGTYSGVGYSNCFSGLATDEVYLIRSECYARAGKVIESMADLNTLLKTRWLGTYVNLTALDKEDALIKVLEERKKELILRGLRWVDLRRLNRDPRFAITITRTFGGKTYTLEPNSYKYTFPIPDDIIEMTKMEQNEGWK